MSVFDRFFTREEEPDTSKAALDQATYALSFAQHPEYEPLIQWLESEADKAFVVGDHLKMVAGVARANALKEVRDHLRRRVRNARALIERIREEQNG